MAMNRIDSCKKCFEVDFLPLLDEFLYRMRVGVTDASNSELDTSDSMNIAGFGQKLRFAIDNSLFKALKEGALPGMTRIPYKGRGNTSPDYCTGGDLSVHINKVDRPGKFPRKARVRENRRDASQANLFSDEDLEKLGNKIDKDNLDSYIYANIVYTADLNRGLTSVYLGFPKNSAEGRGWIFPPIDLLAIAKVISVSEGEEQLKVKMPVLKEDVVKLRKKAAS